MIGQQMFNLSQAIGEFLKDSKDYASEMYQDFLNEKIVEPKCERPGAMFYFWVLKELEQTNFYESPASTKYHCSYRHGLVKHSLKVLQFLFRITHEWNFEFGKYEVEDFAIAAIFHDLCKVNLYLYNEEKNCFYKNNSRPSFGHGTESAHMLEMYEFKFAQHLYRGYEEGAPFMEYHINPDVLEAVRWHMGAYDLGNYDESAYDEAKRRNKLVLALHYADDLSCCW